MRIQLWRMVRKRATWLVVLFLGEMLTTSAMGYYEAAIKGGGTCAFPPDDHFERGNSGSQASMLIIRAMALGEVTLRDWWRVMRKELIAGLMLGLVLGIIGFLRVAVWTQFLNVYGTHWMLIAFTVGLALIDVVLWGSMLPFLLRRVGADPATSSAPFVATLVDATGLIIYFSIALLILRGSR